MKQKSYKSQMKVFGRIKPQLRSTQHQDHLPYSISESKKQLKILPKNKGLNSVYKDNLDFNFTEVLNEDVTQDDVFQTVAKPVIDNGLQGYNGTIFAYGQTGSGKTYTMHGADSWQNRGIIPRTISYIFDQIEEQSNKIQYNIYISFMEIYNENAYDLLDHKHLETPLESWNKINMMEDDFGNIHLKNVSVHQCTQEQQCIDLLMMGNFVRQVSSTPINHASSRSHAVFTITFEGRHLDSEYQFLSKMHLVDLAGSERIHKSNIDGQLMNEAKYINLSLTYLEQVIIALNDKQKHGQRSHIPYRNSLMTTILKDSLGGNCETVMIATVSQELQNYDESISTLRFSQRVGQLETEVRKNEKVNYPQLVKKLNQEKQTLLEEVDFYQKIISQFTNKNIEQLREEYNNNNGNIISLQQNQNQRVLKEIQNSQNETPITFQNKDIQRNLEQADASTTENLRHQIDQYLNEKQPEVQLNDLGQAQTAMSLMKNIYNIRMKEYVTELTYISEKLQSYDDLLSKKKSQASAKKQQSTTSSSADVDNNENEEQANSSFYNEQSQSSQQQLSSQQTLQQKHNLYSKQQQYIQSQGQNKIQQQQQLSNQQLDNSMQNSRKSQQQQQPQQQKKQGKYLYLYQNNQK